MKKYKAYTNLYLTVQYEGHSRHIQFDALSTGSTSVFMTDDPKMQKAIESHPLFNKLIEAEEVKPEPAVQQSVPGQGNVPAPVEIVVSGPDDAKEYIADTFGISRSQLRTVEAIKKAAAENHVVFKGL